MTYTAGVQRVTDDWQGSIDAELSFTDQSDHARLRARATTPLTGDLSLGAHLSLFWADHADGTEEQDHELKVSTAWRPEGQPVVLLEQAEAIREKDAGADEMRLVNSLLYTRELGKRTEVSLRNGLKYVQQQFDGERLTDALAMVGAEYRRDLSDWFDVGVHGAALWSRESRTSRGSIGLSMGLTPFENGWISMGYNATGFRDADFSETGYTDQGAYVQFRYKLDQEGFDGIF